MTATRARRRRAFVSLLALLSLLVPGVHAFAALPSPVATEGTEGTVTITVTGTGATIADAADIAIDTVVVPGGAFADPVWSLPYGTPTPLEVVLDAVGSTLTLGEITGGAAGVPPPGVVTVADPTTVLSSDAVTPASITLTAGTPLTPTITFSAAGTYVVAFVFTLPTAQPTDPVVAHTATLTFVVSAPTTTALTAAPTTAIVDADVVLTATLDPTTAVGTVEFFDGTTSLGTGTVTGGVATLTTSFATAGDHDLTASFTDATNAYAPSVSTPVTVTISEPVAEPIATTTALSADPATAVVDADVVLTATLDPATAVGAVEFFDGTTSLGTGTVTGGVATLTTSFATVGDHDLTATFTDATNAYAPSTSTPVTVTVAEPPAAPTVTIDGWQPEYAEGDQITLTAITTPEVGADATYVWFFRFADEPDPLLFPDATSATLSLPATLDLDGLEVFVQVTAGDGVLISEPVLLTVVGLGCPEGEICEPECPEGEICDFECPEGEICEFPDGEMPPDIPMVPIITCAPVVIETLTNPAVLSTQLRTPTGTWTRPQDTTFYLDANTRASVGDDPRYAFLGPAGSSYYRTAQTYTFGELTLALNTAHPTTTQQVGDAVTFTLDSVSGPGSVFVYDADPDGSVTGLLGGGFGMSVAVPRTTQRDVTWAFTQPGVYVVKLTANGLLPSGPAASTATLTFVVDGAPPPRTASSGHFALGTVVTTATVATYEIVGQKTDGSKAPCRLTAAQIRDVNKQLRDGGADQSAISSNGAILPRTGAAGTATGALAALGLIVTGIFLLGASRRRRRA